VCVRTLIELEKSALHKQFISVAFVSTTLNEKKNCMAKRFWLPYNQPKAKRKTLAIQADTTTTTTTTTKSSQIMYNLCDGNGRTLPQKVCNRNVGLFVGFV